MYYFVEAEFLNFRSFLKTFIFIRSPSALEYKYILAGWVKRAIPQNCRALLRCISDIFGQGFFKGTSDLTVVWVERNVVGDVCLQVRNLPRLCLRELISSQYKRLGSLPRIIVTIELFRFPNSVWITFSI